jgi:hypothetical protein
MNSKILRRLDVNKAITRLCPYSQYLAWKIGRVHYKWYRQFRGAFDKDDHRKVRNQGQNGTHFAEWLASRYYARRGYKVLVEKYTCGARSGIHARKRRIICEILGEDVLGKFRVLEKRHRSQSPDLFVFNDKRHFFVEVKRDRNFLRDCQKQYFSKIKSELGCGVRIFHLVRKKKGANL